MSIVQEFLATEHELMHRLKCTETGRYTAWAPYTHYTYMDGMVGVTECYANYMGKEQVMSAIEFVQRTAIQ